MKKMNLLGIVFAIALCALFIVSEVVWAKPPNPPNRPPPKYGYAKFRDGDGDVIKSDDGRPYGDCLSEEGGEDVVWINVQENDGSLNWVEFFPGKLYYHHPDSPPSTRRVEFCFNVSNIPPGQTQPSGGKTGGNAVLEILRWHKVPGGYAERSNNPGYLDDGSVHAPIMVRMAGQDGDVVQFGVDPLGDVLNPGTDPKAITQEKVNEYYPDDRNVDYLDAQQLPEPEWEPAPYIIYFLNYGVGGFTVTPIEWDEDNKPVTWTISATGNPRLYVKFKSWYGRKIELVDQYPENLPFEFAVSLNPLNEYPTGGSSAPGKNSTLSATWGEIKAK